MRARARRRQRDHGSAAAPPTLTVGPRAQPNLRRGRSNIADLHIGGAITGALDGALPEAERAARAGASRRRRPSAPAVGAAAPVVGNVLAPIRGGLQLDGVAPDRAARMASQMGEVGGFLGQKTLELGGEGVRRAAPVADELAKQAILSAGQQGVRRRRPSSTNAAAHRRARRGDGGAAARGGGAVVARRGAGRRRWLRGAASLLEPLPPAPLPPVKIGGVALPSVPTSPQALQQTATRAVAPYALGGGVALLALGALRGRRAAARGGAAQRARARRSSSSARSSRWSTGREIYATYSLVVLGRFKLSRDMCMEDHGWTHCL